MRFLLLDGKLHRGVLVEGGVCHSIPEMFHSISLLSLTSSLVPGINESRTNEGKINCYPANVHVGHIVCLIYWLF